jgi:hypothetical protein
VWVRFSAQPLAIVAAGCLLAGAIGSAIAAPRPLHGERYFIDFRARPSQYIGHTYVVYFRVDASGRVIEKHHAGLIPEEDVWKGLVSPIRATIRKYKDDTRLLPTVIYRRELTAAEFHRVDRAVSFLRARQHRWHVIFFDCNDFGIEIAEALGMTRPPSLMPPSVWVAMLEKMNGSGR